jgi:hypothetical protein
MQEQGINHGCDAFGLFLAGNVEKQGKNGG